jgi:phage terminase large subunit-like protein
VLLPRHEEWLDDFRSELLQFPKGQHDDQVDQRQRHRMWVRPLRL